ncbi:glycosyltransferase [Paracoccus zhouxuedongae]|uniref:glycosyltransferase n=1 Tax=Paracoccus sp. p4-l81 TaxID=3342806 RepID=UPI0035BBB6DA
MRKDHPASAPRYLVNAANLHAGGGVQVATSAVAELLAQGALSGNVFAHVSDEVAENLAAMDVDPGPNVTRRTIRGFNLTDGDSHRAMQGFDAVLTVFGPLYRWRPRFRSVVGFAQPWIIFPRNECYGRMGMIQRLKTRLKFWIHARFFKRADVLVVELPHVKDGLVRELGIDPARIHVVRNCLSRLFLDPSAWRPVAVPQVDCDLRLGFLGRNYLHKNTVIFPELVRILHDDHGINARVFVTLTDDEWSATTPEFRQACVNVGPLTAPQCPGFYQTIDAVVFPSLLECFSATPLEAMAMQRPLFASDRGFNRDVCGDLATYFDPLDPADAARRIAEGWRAGFDPARLAAARDHAIHFSSPAHRANSYLALLRGAAPAEHLTNGS